MYSAQQNKQFQIKRKKEIAEIGAASTLPQIMNILAEYLPEDLTKACLDKAIKL